MHSVEQRLADIEATLEVMAATCFRIEEGLDMLLNALRESEGEAIEDLDGATAAFERDPHDEL